MADCASLIRPTIRGVHNAKPRSKINKSLLVLFFRKELLALNFLSPDWIFEAGDEGGVGG
jgi:hypothetical protein